MVKRLKNIKLNQEEVKDLGLGTRDLSGNKRIINKDGSFNVRKTGLGFAESFNFYHYLVTISWAKFIMFIFSGYIVLNFVFAVIYYLTGTEHLLGIIAENETERFLEAFYFSAQSFTTVGYGRISPQGVYASTIAAFEALIGLLSLAIATGLVYGRFSRPIPKIIYSKNAVIAPFKEINGFMFRVANKQKSQMVDVEVRVMMSLFENINGSRIRKYYDLELEYNTINFFPTTWTVNHPINEQSPLSGIDKKSLSDNGAEFLVLLKGFDDTFSQTVHDRYSYTADEVVWDAKFVNIFGTDSDGMGTVELEKISEYNNTR